MSQVNFNPNQINDSSYVQKAYISYLNGGDIRVTEEDLKLIEDNYSESVLKGWKIESEEDVNDIELEDEIDVSALAPLETDKEPEKTNGGNNVDDKKTEKVDDKKAEEQKTDVTEEGINSKFTSGQGVKNDVIKNSLLSGLSLGMNIGSIVALNIAGKASWIAGCTIAFAVGILYEATRPNADAHEALMQYEKLMKSYQEAMLNGNVVMGTAADEVDNVKKEAEQEQERIQEETDKKVEEQKQAIEEKNAEQEELAKTNEEVYNAIKERVDNGEEISDEDRAKLDECGERINQLNEEKAEITEETTESVEDLQTEADENIETISEDIKSKQDTISEEAVKLTEIKETTDLVASFDTATEANTIIQAVSQGANIFTGTMSAARAFAAAPLTLGASIPFGIMGIEGAAMSIHGVVEQSLFAKDISEEINTRSDTQDMLNQTAKTYKELYDEFNVSYEGVNSLDLDTTTLNDLYALEEERRNPKTPLTVEGTPIKEDPDGISIGEVPDKGPDNENPVDNKNDGVPDKGVDNEDPDGYPIGVVPDKEEPDNENPVDNKNGGVSDKKDPFNEEPDGDPIGVVSDKEPDNENPVDNKNGEAQEKENPFNEDPDGYPIGVVSDKDELGNEDPDGDPIGVVPDKKYEKEA